MFQIKVVEKIKTHILCSKYFSRNRALLWGNVEKYGGIREATNDSTIRRMRVACWISKARRAYAHAHAQGPEHPPTHTHARARTQRNMQYLLLFHGKNYLSNALQCYVTWTFPLLFCNRTKRVSTTGSSAGEECRNSIDYYSALCYH